jgi:hypothetical protein
MYTHTIGLGRRAGYVLSLAWHDNCCSAATLRALTLPKAAEAELVNPAKRLARWLKLTENRGHIQRGTLFIRALNPTALYHHATVDLDPAETYTARDFLDAGALGAIGVQVIEERNPAVAERRRAELDLLRALLL